MREATLRDFLHGTVSAARLAAEVVHIEDLPADEEVTITPEMLVRLCDAFLAGALPGSAVAETRLSATATVVELPASHTFMMNNRQVRTLVRELLARAAGRDGVTA